MVVPACSPPATTGSYHVHLLALDAESWRSKSNLTLFPSGATSQETHLVLLLEAEGPGKEDGGADEAETEGDGAARWIFLVNCARESRPERRTYYPNNINHWI